ncbi:DEKNAAC104441 [Brettanomyces naardenensis]|uniref:arginyltransferase n=1 Tax=Brettanomyces naardenensis TaxID=13370 RepID=A0A448YQZ8_BRENA|nr:DEKNAAC104441 [Brettanomyces naardenensis]
MPEFDLITGSDVLYIKGKDCGYCHGSKDPMEQGYSLDSYRKMYKQGEPEEYSKYPNSTTMGFVIYMCSPDCYERLMNRGFRRSGTFLYRSDILRNCCRLYTLRTCLRFIAHPTKEHRHTVNRFEKYLRGENNSAGKHVAGVPFDIKRRILDLELTIDGSRFRTVIGPVHATDEKYQLFRKYQMGVHREKESEVSLKGFKRFLCKTPFESKYIDHDDEYWERLNGGWRKGLFEESDPHDLVGPIHECYYLNDKLIAIAVLDILPESISSVYFIWDPDFAHLGLGNLSALRELVLTEMLGKKYYYMGYYIDDCKKMRYKAKFGGEILDICSRKFVRLKDAEKFIEGGRLVVFGTDDEENNELPPLNELEILDDQIDDEFPQGTKLANIAEQIYGFEGGSFTKAERIMRKLRGEIPALQDLDEVDEAEYWCSEGKETMQLPKVSPGLVPLWQIHEISQDGMLQKLLGNLFLYDQQNPGFYRYQPGFDTMYLKQILDLIRLVGPKQFEYPTLYII